MARPPACIVKCAQEVVDTADIVREAISRSLLAGVVGYTVDDILAKVSRG